MWIDTHCHLDAGEFAADRDAVVAQATLAAYQRGIAAAPEMARHREPADVELKRLKELEEENRRLKSMYAELALDLKLAKEIIEKKL